MKNTRNTERIPFQFRAEFFNLWNWHIFEQQSTTLTATASAFTIDVSRPTFRVWNGKVTAPRNIQVGVRIDF